MKPYAKFTIAMFAAAAAASHAFCFAAAPVEPDRAALEKALAEHLATQGDICLGKPAWPIDVTEEDMEIGSRDALQLPVLERLGLVAGQRETISQKTDKGVDTLKITRYELTDAGKAYYKERQAPSRIGDGAPPAKQHDVCIAKLSLDKLVKWGGQAGGTGDRILASYTYRISMPAWGGDPEVQKVFPMLARMMKEQGSLELEQRFRWNGSAWLAISPWE